jgi:DNA polymerase (family 10)
MQFSSFSVFARETRLSERFMKNQQIAKIFNEIAELLDLKGENVFRVRAYRRAAQNIDGLSKDVASPPKKSLKPSPG